MGRCPWDRNKINHRFCNGEAIILHLCISPNRNRTLVVVVGPESAVKIVAGSSATPVIRHINGFGEMPPKE